MEFHDDKIEALAKEAETDVECRLKELKFSVRDIPVLTIFALLFGVVFLQFFTRYILNDSLSWTEEAARYLLIMLAFFGAIKCQSLDSHIRLEFVDQLAGKHVAILKLVALLLTLVFFTVVGIAMVMLSVQTSFQHMVSLPFPKYYLYAFLVISIILLALVQLVQLVRGDWRSDN